MRVRGRAGGEEDRKGPVLQEDIPCCQMRLGTSGFCELGGADLRGCGGGPSSGLGLPGLLGSGIGGDSEGVVSSGTAFGTWGEDHEGSLEHSFGLVPAPHAASPAQVTPCCHTLKYLLTKLWLDPEGQGSSQVPIPRRRQK